MAQGPGNSFAYHGIGRSHAYYPGHRHVRARRHTRLPELPRLLDGAFAPVALPRSSQRTSPTSSPRTTQRTLVRPRTHKSYRSRTSNQKTKSRSSPTQVVPNQWPTACPTSNHLWASWLPSSTNPKDPWPLSLEGLAQRTTDTTYDPSYQTLSPGHAYPTHHHCRLATTRVRMHSSPLP